MRTRGAGLRGLRRRCEQRLEGIAIPQPYAFNSWCDAVASHRGRELRLHPMPGLSVTAPCGMWLSAGFTDYIFFEANTSRLHAEHIVLHELGHIISDHTVGMDVTGSVLRQLMPDLDPTSIRRVLGRVSYTNEQEREAEMIASLVRAKASHPRPGGQGQALAQIAEALNYPA